MANPFPSPVWTVLDSNGDPVAGALLYFYAAGTSTDQSAYTDSALTAARAQGAAVDAGGQAVVYLDPALSYKVNATTSAGAQLGNYPVDNINGADLVTTVKTVATMAALTALTSQNSGIEYHTLGYYAEGDGGHGPYIWNAADTSSADGILVHIPDSLPSVGRFNLVHHGVVRWKQAGAQPSRTAAQNDTAVQALLDAASGNGIVCAIDPATFQHNTLDPGDGDLTISGSGDDSVLWHQEGTSGAPNDLFENTTKPSGWVPFGNMKGRLRFSNFKVLGNRDTAGTINEGGKAFWLDYYESIVFDGVYWLEHNYFPTDIHFCREVTFINCRGRNCSRDLYRARDCFYVNVDHCKADSIGDDVVAAHIQTSAITETDPVREGLTVTGCQFRETKGIHCLGARVVKITDNLLERTFTGSVRVLAGDGTEGDVQSFNIDISRNTCLDSLNVSGSPASNVIAVVVPTPRGTTSSSDTIPGYIDIGGSTVIYPWDFRDLDQTDSGNPIAHVSEIRVCDNIIARTLPAVSNQSDWGFGTFNDSGTYTDPARSASDMTPTQGILMDTGVRRVMITGNHISNVSEGIGFVAPTATLSYEQIIVARNILFDCQDRGIKLDTGAFQSTQFVIESNLFNGDPYALNANSDGDGTYTSDSVPTGIELGASTGIVVRNNKFMNVCNMVTASSLDDQVISGNVAWCLPLAAGFDGTNVGIGTVLAFRQGFEYVVIDADPTSATYLELTNVMLMSATAQPSSGRYIAGWFTLNRVPAEAGSPAYVIIGWQRLTSGTGHVANTDWVEVRGLTGN